MSSAARPDEPATLGPAEQSEDDDPGSPSPAAPAAARPVNSKFEVVRAVGILPDRLGTMAAQDAPFGESAQDSTGLRICVVGAAATGGETLRQLVTRALATPGIAVEIIVFDDCPDTDLGVGPAWRELPGGLHEKLLVNMWLPTIAIRRGHDGEIARHIQAKAAVDPGPFPPRAMAGCFLRERFIETLRIASGSNATVRRVRARASSLLMQADGKPAVDAGGVVYPCEAVVLALGNVPSTSYRHFDGLSGYVANPWAFERWLATVERSASVLVAGTSVTAVDSVIALIENGHQGPVVMFSQGGGLPGARPLHTPAELRLVREDTVDAIAASYFGGGFNGEDDLATLIGLEFSAQGIPLRRLIEVFEQSRRTNVDWLSYTLSRSEEKSLVFGVQKALDDVIPAIWNACRPEAKRTLAGKLGNFARVQWPMAPQNARRILAYMKSGQLIVRGGMGQPFSDGEHFTVPFNDGTTACGDVFINATGIGGHLDNFDCPLVRAMRRRGLLVPHPLWGALADFDTGRLLNSFGQPVGPIWSVASALTRGIRLLTNELSAATRSAVRAADSAFDYALESFAHRSTGALDR